MTTGTVTNRRACLRFIAAVVALSPTAARAQSLANNHRVGVLMTTSRGGFARRRRLR